MPMASFQHNGVEYSVRDGHRESGLSKSYESHYDSTAYPNYQYLDSETYSDLGPVTSAPGMHIPSTLVHYLDATTQPTTTGSLQYVDNTLQAATMSNLDWNLGSGLDQSHVSSPYSHTNSTALVPVTSEYIHAPMYSEIPYSAETTDNYPLQAIELVERHYSPYSHAYTESYVTTSLDQPSITTPTTYMQNDASIPAYTDYPAHSHTTSTTDVPGLTSQELVFVSGLTKSKRRLDQFSVKKANSQIPKQKRVSIIKGDRGKQSRAESCWRCRRYKKPCHKGSGDCSSCMTSGFRIWPSSLGCRRGQMTDFALLIIPSNIEALVQPKTDYAKPMSWRKITTVFDNHFGELNITGVDKWDQLLIKVQAIRVLGPGILELLQVAANYERRQGKPNILLTLTARCLSTTIDLYHIFVATTVGERFNKNLNIKEIFLTLRQLLLSCVQRFLTSCLTGRLKDWFPTFMAVNILGLVYVLLGDTILAVPDKGEVWPDIKKTVMELRTFHPICRDLLYVLAKGCDLLNMNWIDSEEALRLMDDDEVTCDAMRELQAWRDDLMKFLHDDGWMEVAPFERDLLPVMSLSRLFLQIQRKEDKTRIQEA